MNTNDYIGAGLAIISSIISNLGVNVQKQSHKLNEMLPYDRQQPYLKRCKWWVGFFLVVVGSIGDFAAFGFATQTMVAALGGGTTMVSNIVFSKFYNKEMLFKSDIIGVVWIIIGVVVIAVITDPDKEYSLHELELRFVRKGFLIYISIVIVCTLSLSATIKGSLANKLKNQLRWSRQRQKRLMKYYERRFQALEERLDMLEKTVIPLTEANGDFFPRESEVIKRKQKQLELVDDVMEGLASRDHVPYYYAICAGVVGAISVLLAKCSALMIRLTISGSNEFVYPVTYAFVGGMLLSIMIQTHLLNVATSLGDTMTVFPMFQAFWISFSVIGGIVFYDSEKDFTTTKWVLYPMSLVCVGIGVLLLLEHEGKRRTFAKSKASNAPESTQSALSAIYDSDNEAGTMQEPLLTIPATINEGYLHLEAS